MVQGRREAGGGGAAPAEAVQPHPGEHGQLSLSGVHTGKDQDRPNIGGYHRVHLLCVERYILKA